MTSAFQSLCYHYIRQESDDPLPRIFGTKINNFIDHVKMIQKKYNIISLDEIDSIYKNKNYLVILQCTSTYPTIDKEVNLQVIQTLKDETKMTVGYSDHTIGGLALRIAYLYGAEVLEFHFTDSREGKTFRDHKISLTLKETNDLINDLRRIKIMMGKKEKKPTKGEIDSKNIISFRRAIYSSKFLKKGYRLRKEDLVFLRPNHGVDAREYKKIIGKKIKKDIQPFEKLIIERKK